VNDLEQVAVVVPCFNESNRINIEAFAAMTATPGVSVLFVDDGSEDETPAMLATAVAGVQHASVLTLRHNLGKAEAVRLGMRSAIEKGADVVGYLDADGATSPEEWLRLVGVLRDEGADAVCGSRVAMLGYDVQRRRFRHYTGRVFATLAAVAVGQPVYDTQCGAKVFAVTPRFVESLRQSFRSRWVFDVELLQRLFDPSTIPGPPARVVEEPLRRWVDRPGSSLSLWASLRSVVDVLGLAWVGVRSRRHSDARRPS
jgi:dolichyl-phosphate beta-glucosyltransferase